MGCPCENCIHFIEEQTEQFEYRLGCDLDAPDGVFLTEWGCYRYETVQYQDR